MIIVSFLFSIHFYADASSVDDSSQSLYVSAKSLLNELSKNQDFVLIDVRDKNEFEEYHIPDSINIPLYTIKTKGFLRDKRLVLINNGFNLKSLKETGEALVSKGYSIRILQGGLLAWQKAGGNLIGDAAGIKDINLISSEELFSEISKDSGNIVVINLTSASDNKTNIDLPGKVNVPVKDIKDIPVIVSDQIKKNGSNPYINLLITDKDGGEYETIDHALSEYKDINIFYLRGGTNSYQAFLNKQAMLKNRKKIGVEKENECSTCSR
ncbi:MAG: rhodanese-like domain-containing protein [Deltaproteobacteria bacterium]|nr:rhodanese-like domain-containing protein [Deltaproteobacteria bacterium]